MYKHCRNLAIAIGFVLLPCLIWAQVPGTGRVHIKPEQSYSGTPPLTKPASIVVYDFAVTPEDVKLNKSALNRVRMRMSGNQQDEQTKLAHKVADDFSTSLIKDLQKTGFTVVKGTTGEPLPENSLAIQGEFLQVDEGNRTRRMAIGLGAGASKVAANVECYLQQGSGHTLVSQFQATSESSRKPGAAETMGAGAAPEIAAGVGGATEMKQNAEGDTGRMAKAIAKQITKNLTEQGWMPTSNPSETR